MTNPKHLFGPLARTARLAAVAACSLALITACGGGGDDTAELKTPAELAKELQGAENGANNNDERDNGSDDGSDDPTGSERTGTIAFMLPDAGATPAGFTMIEDACTAESGGGVVTYAVPDDWDNSGGGNAGGNGDLEGSVDHRFTTPDGEVIIEIAGDRRDDGGQILNGSGDPSESFDYDYTVGDRTTEVEFSPVTTLSLEYQDVEVYSVDEATYPDVIDGEEFRVRFEAFTSEWDQGGIEQSSVMTISGPTGAVDDELLETIVGSMQLNECARRSILVGQEMISSADLDGDGKVSDGDDMMALPNNS